MIYFIIIAIGLLGIVLYKYGFSKPANLPALPPLPGKTIWRWFTGRVFLEISTFFLVLTALWVAFYMWNPDAPIFTTTEGWVHIGIYYLLSALAAMVDANIHGKSKRRTAWVMMAIVFTIVGFRTATLLPLGVGDYVRQAGGYFGWGSANASYANTNCPGTIEHVVLGPEPRVINPHNLCRVDFRVESGWVEVSGSGGEQIIGPEGGELGSFPIENFRAVGSVAEMIYALCPAGTSYESTGCR